MDVFAIDKMCKVLKISRSSYYYWLTQKPSKHLLNNLEMEIAVKKIYDSSLGIYGNPRITKELQMQGEKISRPFVARLMKKKNLRSVIVRKFKATTGSNHDYRVFDNKLAQNFNVSDYNRAWVSDITYIKTWQGWQYLTTVIDLCNRKVIGWQISNTLRSEDTVIPTLNKACSNSPIKKGGRLFFTLIEGYNTHIIDSKKQLKATNT